MSDFSTLSIQISRKTATVTLSRPEVHNAFNEQMISELTEVFASLSDKQDIRVIVLQANGKHFCAGADLDYMSRAAELDYEQNVAAAKAMAKMFHTINYCPKPVIAKVHGAILGGGVGLCAVCDTVVATEDTKFTLSEIRLGILPAVIGPYMIAKIGYSHFRSLGIAAERFDANTALRIGLIHEIAPLDKLDEAVKRRVDAFSSCAPEAIAIFKTYVDTLETVEQTNIIEHAAKLISQARTSAEGREGIAAFLEKRIANWVEPIS